MSDLGLSGIAVLPLDCGAADRVKLLDRPLTGCDITVTPPVTAGAFQGLAAIWNNRQCKFNRRVYNPSCQ